MSAGFRIIRILDDGLTASDCVVEVSIEINTDSDPSESKNRLKAMKYWISNFLDGSVAFGIGTEIDTTILEQVSNSVMMCPDDPHDYLLLSLIHSKLSAIGGRYVEITRSKLTSDTGEGFSHVVVGNASEMLPAMSEWIGARSYHSVPWWNRDDSSTMDLKPDDDDDISVRPELGIDLIKAVASEKKATQDSPTQVAEIIKPPFRPRIISSDD